MGGVLWKIGTGIIASWIGQEVVRSHGGCSLRGRSQLGGFLEIRIVGDFGSTIVDVSYI